MCLCKPIRFAGNQPIKHPAYDPIVDTGPGHNRDYVPIYWIDTAGSVSEDDGPVSEDFDADVVIQQSVDFSRQ